jgi:hypothetical protein
MSAVLSDHDRTIVVGHMENPLCGALWVLATPLRNQGPRPSSGGRIRPLCVVLYGDNPLQPLSFGQGCKCALPVCIESANLGTGGVPVALPGFHQPVPRIGSPPVGLTSLNSCMCQS